MPCRQTQWFVGFVLADNSIRLWARYWSPIRAVPLNFHVHALSSCTLLMVLIVQSVAIHSRSSAFRRKFGLARLTLFPLMILGCIMILDVSVRNLAAEKRPFSVDLNPSFASDEVLSNIDHFAFSNTP